MARWDLNLRPIYSQNEPNFTESFGNSLVTELERQRAIKEQARQERIRLSTTPGVTFEAPVRAQTTPLPQPVPIFPRPQYDHATGKLLGITDANAGRSGFGQPAGTPRPTVGNESPLEQSLAALQPVYNEIPLAGGGAAYFDPNYSARQGLQEKVVTGRQARWEKEQTDAAARARAGEEYQGLLAANPANTRLGRKLREIGADTWANNPTLRDDILKQGNTATPEETFAQQRGMQDDRQAAQMQALAATLAGRQQSITIQTSSAEERAAADRASREAIAAANRANQVTIQGMPRRSGGTGTNDFMGLLNSEMGATPGASGASAGAGVGKANYRTYAQQIARDPAFKGQPENVVRAEAQRRRVLELMRTDPTLTEEALSARLRAEGFM